jgi:hypothetical integral membrane protein (TIGR02206 family)
MLSAEHAWPIVVIAVTIALLLWWAGRMPPSWVRPVALVLGAGLVLAEASWWLLSIVEDRWSLEYNLPFHICEAACFIGAVALWKRNQFAFEIMYFWILGGSLPGLFTPNIPGHFPDAVYFQYYAEHGLLVFSTLYMVLVMHMRPLHGAVMRVSVATALYAYPVALVDYVTGGNYMFLRSLPPTRTLLDYMGPWPWYLVILTPLAVLVFTVLYLPFARDARRQGLTLSAALRSDTPK